MEQPHSIALLVPEIKELLAQRNYPLIKQVIRECNALDFADSWRSFKDEEKLQIFRLLSATSALKLFEILDIEDQKYLFERAGDDSLFPVLEGMDTPDLAKIFNKMPARAIKKMTSLIKRQTAISHIENLMKFPENTAGSLMHPEFVKLSPRLTAKQALLLLQSVIRPAQKDHLNSLFVISDEGRVLGSLSVPDLITAPEESRLSELMDSVEGIKVRPETDQEEVSKLFSKYQINAAPVVDETDKLLGVIIVKDILSIIKQEATEDIAKMAGTRAKDLREVSAFKIVFFRMPWLVVTLFGGMLISLIIRHFEPVIAKAIALASFSPLIAGMGGNVGSQSATIVVRSLALGHLESRAEQLKAVLREFRVGLMLGLIYGALLAGFAYVVYGQQYGYKFGIVVAVGMSTSMTVAATMGSIEPILFHRNGIDPATATGPLITTITDIISNFVYFSLATVLLLSL
ncbi:MAG TPA: magnesium transporter [Candidatus Eisenbacteria bacterium]|jgi:magnesium transporter|nr:magnesium transporter [Candidatus Eisenbacteria bacterium]